MLHNVPGYAIKFLDHLLLSRFYLYNGSSGMECSMKKEISIFTTSFHYHETIKTKPLTFISMKNELNCWWALCFCLYLVAQGNEEKKLLTLNKLQGRILRKLRAEEQKRQAKGKITKLFIINHDTICLIRFNSSFSLHWMMLLLFVTVWIIFNKRNALGYNFIRSLIHLHKKWVMFSLSWTARQIYLYQMCI